MLLYCNAYRTRAGAKVRRMNVFVLFCSAELRAGGTLTPRVNLAPFAKPAQRVSSLILDREHRHCLLLLVNNVIEPIAPDKKHPAWHRRTSCLVIRIIDATIPRKRSKNIERVVHTTIHAFRRYIRESIHSFICQPHLKGDAFILRTTPHRAPPGCARRPGVPARATARDH